MKTSVVIPAYNEEKNLQHILNSLQHQTQKPDEIIVVDNNSDDKTAAVARQYGAKVIKEAKQGIARARDAGFNAAKYKLIIRFDADSVISPDYIERISQVFQDSTVVAASARVVFDGLPAFIPGLLIEVPFNYSAKMFRWRDTLLGPNMAVRKSAWDRVKDDVCSHDIRFNEDLDLAIHLARIGKIKQIYNIVVHTSARRITHRPRSFFFGYSSMMMLTLLSHLRNRV